MNIAIALIGAIMAGTAAVILRHGKISNPKGFITLTIIVTAGMIGAAALIAATNAALNPGTGETLKCAQQENNTLTCTIEKGNTND